MTQPAERSYEDELRERERSTREFCDLVLRPGAPTAQFVIRRPVDRGPQLHPRAFTGGQAAAAVTWIGPASEVFAPVHFNYRQSAAAVCLPQGTGSVELACFNPEPTLAVTYEDDQTVYAAWLYTRAVRWFAHANLSHAIARRLGARPVARIPVVGSSRWAGDRFAACRTVTVSGSGYDPDELAQAVKSQRRRRTAA